MKNNGIHIEDWVGALSNQKLFYLAVIDVRGKLTFLNTHFFRSFHLTSASLINDTFYDFIHPNDLKRFKLAADECSQYKKAMITEVRIKNGTYRWVKWEITSLKKPGSELDKLLCLGYDIACEDQINKYNTIGDENYQAIVEGLNIGVIFQDNEGTLISANQKSAEIFDTTLEKLFSEKNIYSLLEITNENGDLLPFSEAPFMKALSTGQTQSNVVLNLQIRKGIYRSVLCNSQPLFKKDQTKAFSVVSTILDLTQEKKLEVEVKMREALFTSFMNHTPYFAWIADKNKKLVFANQSLLSYFNGDESAFGKYIIHLIPATIAIIFLEKHATVLKEKLKDHSIVKCIMADGRQHVYQVTVFPIQGKSSETMIGGEAMDITETYNARNEIRKTNEHLLYLSKATSEAIWDWNMQTGDIFCNLALHNLVGSDLNEVYDLDWCYQCIHPDDIDKLKRRIKSVLEKKEQSWETEYRFKNTDGSYKMLHNRGFVIYENNQPIRMICSLQDISKIKKLETQLLEQKLKQQKGIAEAIIQSQEEERTRIGHELHDNVNQILSTAQLYISLLDPHKDNFAEIKKKSMETILLGIEEIRILSKEMVIPTLKGEGLIASINDIVNDLRFINLFHINFTYNKQCDIESISKNKKTNLYRIIQEQVKNIIKYSKAKNVEISLDFINNQIRLSIKDDGIGFDSKNTRRGLGLSNIYERTRLDNGKIILTTSPGNGCSLIVNIANDGNHIFSKPLIVN
jgi:PAS domain S-box-containing protein